MKVRTILVLLALLSVFGCSSAGNDESAAKDQLKKEEADRKVGAAEGSQFNRQADRN